MWNVYYIPIRRNPVCDDGMIRGSIHPMSPLALPWLRKSMPAGHKVTDVSREAGAQWSKLTAAKKKKYVPRPDEDGRMRISCELCVCENPARSHAGKNN